MTYVFTLVICMLNNNLLSTLSLPHRFVEVVIDVVTLPSCIIKRKKKTILSSTSMCYVKCHNVNNFALQIVTYLGK
jgi:hypothetical protein